MDQEKCLTCLGEGVVSGVAGPEDCPDCFGLGVPPSENVRVERHLRELEQRWQEGQAKADVGWLVLEVRRARHALLQILTASQDLAEDDALARKVRFLANQALGLYKIAATNEDD